MPWIDPAALPWWGAAVAALAAAAPNLFQRDPGGRSPKRERAETDSTAFVVRATLKLRARAELDSEETGVAPSGLRVRVLERRELADGTRRARIGAAGEADPGGVLVLDDEEMPPPLGWVSCAGRGVAASGVQTFVLSALRVRPTAAISSWTASWACVDTWAGTTTTTSSR